ncbi:hypothetical protein BWQ96_06953 [Gracilariopsis chorda]|uniref:Uncharacterized protein n=1 Tax=Gracilariopsis chorda TaxID=448386 RepID=A0A2V3IMJ5_9FLOR|nr:hypothetical protein BWQ96_06953 [Gracilariopsis chorda]|eukprot:PXF43314.1 hypothetical protein BWQ96_06953 [Gracilariopsis chorda]
MRQPLIRFRYAIEKARAAGASHPALTTPANASVAAPAASANEKLISAPITERVIPAPSGVVRTSERIDKAPSRANISEEEMDAIMLGGAL